jgi:SmpA / OmlA family
VQDSVMTRSRPLLVLGAISVLGFVALSVVTFRARGPGITPANYERIREGMTEQQVEALLGGPATGTRTAPYGGSYVPEEFEAAGVKRLREWIGDGTYVLVGFNKAVVVTWKASGQFVVRQWKRLCPCRRLFGW